MPPKRKGKNIPRPKFDKACRPAKPQYPPMPKAWRSAEEYFDWENQCEKLRNEWEKDVDEWKTLFEGDSDWEVWDLEEESEDRDDGLDDPRWGPNPTYAVVPTDDRGGLGREDPRMPHEQLVTVLPALLKIVCTYEEVRVTPTVANVFDGLEDARENA